MTGRKGISVAEASGILGISEDGVRKRINRGTLMAEKLDGETWTVYLDSVPPKGKEQDDSHYWELIQDQREEIERLRAELEQNKNWISELLQSQKELIERIPPQLPAPEEPEQAATRENWWQRLWSRK